MILKVVYYIIILILVKKEKNLHLLLNKMETYKYVLQGKIKQ